VDEEKLVAIQEEASYENLDRTIVRKKNYDSPC
jgi:hypothetical protein